MSPRCGRRDIWEIPDSDESDQSDEDTPLEDQSDSTAISPSSSTADSAENPFIDIEKHFPKGRGLFLPPPSAVEPEAPAASTIPSQANASQQPDPTHHDAVSLWSDSADPIEVDGPPFLGQTSVQLFPDQFSTASCVEVSDENTSQDGQEIKPANRGAAGREVRDKYKRVLAGVEAVISRYDQESNSDVGDLNKIPVQWPFPKISHHKNARICLCKRQTVRSRVVSQCQRCYDPACEVAGGWYHLKCLTKEELREVSSSGKFSNSYLCTSDIVLMQWQRSGYVVDA